MRKTLLTIFTGVLLFSTSAGVEAATGDESRIGPLVFGREDNEKTEFVIKPFAGIYGGWESNVHKSPEDANNMTDIPQDDTFLKFDFGLKMKKYWGWNQRLKLNYKSDFQRYSSEAALDETKHKIATQYRHRFNKKFYAYLDGEFKDSTEKATNVLGDGLTRAFSYIQYEFGPSFKYEFNSLADLQIYYKWRRRDYEETSGLESLDYAQNKIGVNFRLSYFNIEYDYWLKNYRQYTARDDNGDVLADNPRREWAYHTVTLGFEKEFNEYLEIGLEYQYRRRIDTFEDYYTYNQNKIGGKIRLKPTKTTQCDLGVAYKMRQYEVLEAPVPGPNPKLEADYWDVKVGVSQWVIPNVKLYLEYTLDYRDTNKETGLTWREYSDHTIMGGVAFEL